MDDGPGNGSCASKMAIEVFRKRLRAAGVLFPSSSCEVFPSQFKTAFIILYVLMFLVFAIWMIKLKSSLQKLSFPITISIQTLENKVLTLQQTVDAGVAPGSQHCCICCRHCSALAVSK